MQLLQLPANTLSFFPNRSLRVLDILGLLRQELPRGIQVERDGYWGLARVMVQVSGMGDGTSKTLLYFISRRSLDETCRLGRSYIAPGKPTLGPAARAGCIRRAPSLYTLTLGQDAYL